MDARVLRDACDACHRNKTKCTSSGGPCDNCRMRGSPCNFSQRSKMGRPRFRPGSLTRTKGQRKKRRDSAACASTTSESDSVPTPPEVQDLVSDPFSQLSDAELSLLPTFDSDETYSLGLNLKCTAPSQESCQLNTDSSCERGVNASPYSFTSANLVDEMRLANMLTGIEASDLFTLGNYSWTPETHLPTASELDESDVLQISSQNTAKIKLPQILYGLRTISQKLKSSSTSRAQWDEVIVMTSCLCDIIQASKSRLSTVGQLESSDPIIVATTVPVVIEIYSVLADELSSTCNSWSGQHKPRTQVFLDFHRYAFAIDLHLTELREALDMAGLAAYDAHTAQAMDHVHIAVQKLLLRWQPY